MTWADQLGCDFKFVLLPFPSEGGDWYAYIIHEDIPDLDEKLWAKGKTAGKCAAALERKVKKYVKDNTPRYLPI